MTHGQSKPNDPYELASASADRLAELTDAVCGAATTRFDVAVVLGSGWMAAADAIGATEHEVSLADLGGFAEPTVGGHHGSVRYVRAEDGKRVLVFLGRVHLYEGHSPATVVHGVRTAIAAGCRTVVLTNAAGGIEAGFRPGQ